MSFQMARLDNPAGRLHALLTEYRATATDQRSIRATWAHVLGVSEDEAAVAVIEVGGLIPAIESAVARAGDEAQQEVLSYYRLHWATPITTPDYPTGKTPSPGKALVDVGALTALGGLSSFLSSVASEGVVPDAEQIQSLRDKLSHLIEELAGADTFPSQFQRLLLDRLHSVLWALDHFRIGGPEATTAAAERLLGSIQLAAATTPEVRQHRAAIARVVETVGAVWAIFKAGPTVRNALEAWSTLSELPSGP